jgi:hypothetical protein
MDRVITVRYDPETGSSVVGGGVGDEDAFEDDQPSLGIGETVRRERGSDESAEYPAGAGA